MLRAREECVCMATIRGEKAHVLFFRCIIPPLFPVNHALGRITMKTLVKIPLAKVLVPMLGALAFSGTALAQDSMPSSSSSSMGSMGGMHGGKSGMKAMHHMMGMHAMPATVTSVDKSTGIVEVESEGMNLKVHFPPTAEANLKAGDKITLHMGFSEP